jgi:hypothetical protein
VAPLSNVPSDVIATKRAAEVCGDFRVPDAVLPGWHQAHRGGGLLPASRSVGRLSDADLADGRFFDACFRAEAVSTLIHWTASLDRFPFKEEVMAKTISSGPRAYVGRELLGLRDRVIEEVQLSLRLISGAGLPLGKAQEFDDLTDDRWVRPGTSRIVAGITARA